MWLHFCVLVIPSGLWKKYSLKPMAFLKTNIVGYLSFLLEKPVMKCSVNCNVTVTPSSRTISLANTPLNILAHKFSTFLTFSRSEWLVLKRNKKSSRSYPQAQTVATKRSKTRPADIAPWIHLPESWGPKGCSLSQSRLTQHAEKHLISKAWKSETQMFCSVCCAS